MSDASLIIPGVIHVGTDESSRGIGAPAQVGLAVGWTMPRGVHTWSRELSVVIKEEVTPALQRELGVVLPEEQGDPEVVPRARRAAQSCNLVAVDGEIADQVLAKGLRVHTVGVDRVSNGFFYISKGGNAPAKRVQGGLIEMVASSMDQPGSNADLEASSIVSLANFPTGSCPSLSSSSPKRSPRSGQKMAKQQPNCRRWKGG